MEVDYNFTELSPQEQRRAFLIIKLRGRGLGKRTMEVDEEYRSLFPPIPAPTDTVTDTTPSYEEYAPQYGY